MTSKDLVRAALAFERPERMPYDFPQPYPSDFFWCMLDPNPDELCHYDMSEMTWTDEWGCVWRRLGRTLLGEVKNRVLEDYDDLDKLRVPDVLSENRWAKYRNLRADKGDKYALGGGISLYFRIQFLRGVEDTWVDIYENPEGLGRLIDLMVDLNLKVIERYRQLGADGIIFSDDWGLQNTLQIRPESWRKIWKPRYERIFKATHDAGMNTFLHCCGYIVDILDDLIEIGLDAVHMDQQENMGLDLLSKRFGGRLTFFAPVDIQKTMNCGDMDKIAAYCAHMKRAFYKNGGGFIPRWYTDPEGAGHTQQAIDTMCQTFLEICDEVRA